MSKYIEVGYIKTIKNITLNAFVGAALDDPDTNAGETGFYLNEKPGITNLGLKLSRSIQITDTFSLPIQCSLMTNPSLKKVYLTFGISI
jgi:hypothetical protein